MNLLAGLLVVFLGLIIQSNILVAFGLITVAVQLIFDYLKKEPKPAAQAAKKPKAKHKLIDAPQDMWKNPQDDIWQAMQTGPAPMMITGHRDFMGDVATSGFRDPHTRAIVRNMLPFPNYANQGVMGVVDNMFFGLPFPIGKYIRGR